MIQEFKTLAYRLLRRGERYTGTDNVYLAKGGFFLTFASFMGSASSLVLAILFARLVDKGVYGTYQYLLSWGAILAISSISGMSDALTRAVAQGHEKTIYPVLKTRLRWAALGTALGIGIGAYYLTKGRVDLSYGFLIVAAFFPINAALSSWADYAIGKKSFSLQTRYSVMSTLVAAVAVISVMLIHPTAVTLALAFGGSYLAVNAFALLATLRAMPPQGEASAEAVRFGKKLTFLDVISSIANYLDRILVFTLLGSHETAVYAFAMAPPEQLKGYLKNLYVMALPKIAERPLSEIKKNFYRKLFVLWGAVGAIILAYVLAAPIVYRWLFPAYQESVGYSMLFAVSLLAVAAVLPIAVFNGHQRYRENFNYQVTTSIVGIATLAVFVWKWGLPGAVAARVVTRFFGLAYSLYLVDRVFKEASQAPPPSHSPSSAAPATP